ncbi:MAG: HEXXH motif-containing putative peptide modification protein, partial [Candidatus Eremiobacteraeota bacterium]|nr:HEXXH motif-containing putative peptide modification protein [Candidatus Eremiobacteraeota bacterium]
LKPVASAHPVIFSIDRRQPAPHHLRFVEVVNDSIYDTYKTRNDFSPLEGGHRSFAGTRTALERLAIVDKDLSDELEALLSEILLVESTTFNAGTSLHALGVVWMSHLKDGHTWTRYYEHLVHESAHHHLFYVLYNDPLYLNDPQERYSSPFRSEMRPISGIYHGMFVLARTLRAVRALERSAKYDSVRDAVSTSHNNAKNPSSFEEKFEDCWTVLRQHAKLTETGRAMMNGAREMAYA